MNFTHYKLGHCQRGQVVEITLSGSAANVRLMDNSALQAYRNGRRHQYFGGLARQSPVRLQIPRTGTWNVTVDMMGLRGSTRSSIRMLPAPLPNIQERPLTSVPSLVQQPPSSGVENADQIYDVFISHASEDKDELVRPLALALKDTGLRVWYDEFELKIGDSLRRKIDHGLVNSRVGIVVISHAFIKKGWTNYELDGLVTKSVTQEQVLLPIWHNISKNEVIDYSPSLADKVARSTATHTVDEIAKEIHGLISGEDHNTSEVGL